MVQSYQAVPGVEHHADGVEAVRAGTRTVADLGQVRARHLAHLLALRLAQRVPRTARPGAPRLDLAEDERVPVVGHEVDLAEARAVVARENREASAGEVLGREVLAAVAEAMAQVGGHATTVGGAV